MSSSDKIVQLSNVGGVWSPPWYPALSYYNWLPLPKPYTRTVVEWLELVAEDFTFQFKTTEQRFDGTCTRPYL